MLGAPEGGMSHASREEMRLLERQSPASQTLIVWSRGPETMVLPSGEKATLITQWLCAFSFVALSSRVPEKHAERVSEASAWQLEKAETAHLRPIL